MSIFFEKSRSEEMEFEDNNFRDVSINDVLFYPGGRGIISILDLGDEDISKMDNFLERVNRKVTKENNHFILFDKEMLMKKIIELYDKSSSILFYKPQTIKEANQQLDKIIKADPSVLQAESIYLDLDKLMKEKSDDVLNFGAVTKIFMTGRPFLKNVIISFNDFNQMPFEDIQEYLRLKSSILDFVFLETDTSTQIKNKRKKIKLENEKINKRIKQISNNFSVNELNFYQSVGNLEKNANLIFNF